MLGNITNLILLFRLGLGSKSSISIRNFSSKELLMESMYALTKISMKE